MVLQMYYMQQIIMVVNLLIGMVLHLLLLEDFLYMILLPVLFRLIQIQGKLTIINFIDLSYLPMIMS